MHGQTVSAEMKLVDLAIDDGRFGAAKIAAPPDPSRGLCGVAGWTLGLERSRLQVHTPGNE